MTADKGLKGQELFAKLNVDEINQLDRFSHVKEFKKDEIIFEYGQVCSHIYMLMSGTVFLMLPANPADYSFAIAEIEKNEIFGLSPILKSPRYTAQAKCHNDCKVLAIEAEPFMKMLDANHNVGLGILNEVARIYYLRYLDILRKLQDIVSHVSIVK